VEIVETVETAETAEIVSEESGDALDLLIIILEPHAVTMKSTRIPQAATIELENEKIDTPIGETSGTGTEIGVIAGDVTMKQSDHLAATEKGRERGTFLRNGPDAENAMADAMVDVKLDVKSDAM
jgi:hypothetical protein